MTTYAEQLWQQLRREGKVTGDMPETAPPTPLYVMLLQGMAGWLAALFLLGFTASMFAWLFEKDNLLLLSSGGMLHCLAAYLLYRIKRSQIFYAQLALALSLCGQLMVAWSVFSHFSADESGAFFVLALFQALLALLMPNFLHRLLSSWFAMIALFWGFNMQGIFGLGSALCALIFTLLWCNEPRWLKRYPLWEPLGYGLAFALIQFSGHLFFRDGFSAIYPETEPGLLQQYGPQLGSGLLILSCLLFIGFIIRQYKITPLSATGAPVLGGSLLLLLGCLPVTGVSAALLVLLVGFHFQRFLLLGTGILALLGFISGYYYNLQITLLLKSLYLLLSGLALLAVYLWIRPKSATKQQASINWRTPQVFVTSVSILGILLAVNLTIQQKETLLAEGRTVLLELAPVDPRSLMQGDYMRLRFAVSRELKRPDYNSAGEGYLRVKLDKNQVGHFLSQHSQPGSTTADSLYLKYRYRSGRIKFATNAFFFEEGTANQYEQARYGEFKVAENGELLLHSLRDEEFRLLGYNQP